MHDLEEESGEDIGGGKGTARMAGTRSSSHPDDVPPDEIGPSLQLNDYVIRIRYQFKHLRDGRGIIEMLV
jgi:hypothetical protein